MTREISLYFNFKHSFTVLIKSECGTIITSNDNLANFDICTESNYSTNTLLHHTATEGREDHSSKCEHKNHVTQCRDLIRDLSVMVDLIRSCSRWFKEEFTGKSGVSILQVTALLVLRIWNAGFVKIEPETCSAVVQLGFLFWKKKCCWVFLFLLGRRRGT